MRKLYWINDEINRLDVVKDAQRIAHLAFEVKYGFPMFVYGLFSMAFARQVAVPGIAEVLYRNGKGIILSKTRKRNEDTLVFFGMMFKYIGTDEGRKVIEKVLKLHAPYKITNDLNLYTLATLTTLPTRLGRQFLGRDIYTDKEYNALYHFWKEVGMIMEIKDIPPSSRQFEEWCINYEQSEYTTTKAGIEVTKALAEDFAQVWFPRGMRSLGKQFYYCLFDDHLLETHQIAKPGKTVQRIMSLFVNSYFKIVNIIPDPKDRNLIEVFGKRYGKDFSFKDVGPQPTDN